MGDVRVNFVFNDALTEGNSVARVPLVFAEPLTEGYANVNVDFVYSEPLSEGYSKVNVDFVLLECLVPIPPEEFMTTISFPGFGATVEPPALSPLPGLSFSVHKKPTFSTNIHRASSGREVRNALMAYPIWEFELNYEFLEDRSGADSSLKTLMGFYLETLGPAYQWLFKDPDDYLVEAGPLGTADGVTTQFYFRRVMGNFSEIVGQVDDGNTITLYADGVEIDPGDYTVTMPNYVVFDSAPADGVEITADFQFFFVCRFADDEMDFEKFMDQLWACQTCSFVSTIQ